MKRMMLGIAAAALLGFPLAWFTVRLDAGGDSSHVPVLVRAFALAQGTMTDEEKIADAMSAGPASISQEATILDWPSARGEDFRVLREGTNGWVCLPTSPRRVAEGLTSAICDDEVWQAWGAAFGAREEPVIERVGITYSLSWTASGSNTDPDASGPTDDNDWHAPGSHVAILVPGLNYEGVSTDPHNGGPYVMYPGTPYAHIMVPVGAQPALSTVTDEKIADAMSAGPASLSQDATIMDWPSEPGGEYRILREGSNGWVCFTSSPRAVEAGMHDSFCDDEMWQEWGAALGEGRDPVITRVGISYMLLGDAGLSNTDPFATEPSEDNDWHVNGPHIMILLPDASLYEGISTDPHNGGSFIMFPDTPYAHIMVPIAPSEAGQ